MKIPLKIFLSILQRSIESITGIKDILMDLGLVQLSRRSLYRMGLEVNWKSFERRVRGVLNFGGDSKFFVQNVLLATHKWRSVICDFSRFLFYQNRTSLTNSSLVKKMTHPTASPLRLATEDGTHSSLPKWTLVINVMKNSLILGLTPVYKLVKKQKLHIFLSNLLCT